MIHMLPIIIIFISWLLLVLLQQRLVKAVTLLITIQVAK